MNTLGILSVQFQARGVQQVLNSLMAVQTASGRAQAVINGLAVASTAFATAAAAMAGASLLAYDSFARFEMGAKSLLGTLEGGRFAKAVQQFSVPSAFDPQLLRKGAQGLISTGMTSGRSMDVLKSVTNLAAAGGSSNEEISRTLLALRQIQTKGVARAEEINQQIADSLPLLISAVREQAGRDPIGMKAGAFFDAVIRAGGKYSGSQEKLAAASPVIAIENAWQAVQNSLIPTGRALAVILNAILVPLQGLIGVFSALNEASGGLLGLGIIGTMVTAAAAALSAYVRLQIVGMAAMETQTEMSYLSARALALLANSAMRAAGTNSGGMANLLNDLNSAKASLGKKANLGAAVANLLNPTKLLGGISKAPGLAKTALSAGWGLLKPLLTLGNLAKATGWGLVISLAVSVIPRLFANLGKIFGALWRALSEAWERFSQTPFGSAIVKLFEALGMIWETIVSILSLDWLVDLMGLNEPDAKNSELVSEAVGGDSSRTRPIRRSDAENWYYGRLADIR